ncbi:MAG: hypothetical protein U9N55_02155, partial [candidate division Zixibacteria bacterium]|nr:hypothetical protein [candidate division Zixibacteria bacterium]
MINGLKAHLISTLCLLFLVSLTGNVHAQSKIGSSTLTYLKIVNSPRANGMGGCTVNLVDEHSPLYNPGAMGLFHLDKVVAISTPLTKTKWIMDDIHLSTYGLSLGGSLDLLKYDPDRDYNASAALAIYRTSLN